MVVKHREGSKHGNVDALSRIQDPLSPCFKYISGIKLADLPCGGCHYRTRAHNQWAKFTDEVDKAVSLAVQEGKAPLTVVNERMVGSRCCEPWSMGVFQVFQRKVFSGFKCQKMWSPMYYLAISAIKTKRTMLMGRSD